MGIDPTVSRCEIGLVSIVSYSRPSHVSVSVPISFVKSDCETDGSSAALVKGDRDNVVFLVPPGAVLRVQAEDRRRLRGEQQHLLPPRLHEGDTTVHCTNCKNVCLCI